jgi:hypothetical protein
MVRKSSTDMILPIQDIPYAESEEPIREKLRSDRELPMWLSSNTDMKDPSRASP